MKRGNQCDLCVVVKIRNEVRRVPRLTKSERVAQEAGNDELLDSASHSACSVGGTDDESHPERLDDFESSTTKFSPSRTARSRASRNV